MLAVEVQFGGVLDAQHDGVRGHAAHAALDVRLQYVGPFEGVVLEESVRSHGVGLVPAGWGMLAAGHGAEAFKHLDRPFVAPLVAQVHRLKLLCRPVHVRFVLLNSQHTLGD